jgi:heme-binding NEAT domain protein
MNNLKTLEQDFSSFQKSKRPSKNEDGHSLGKPTPKTHSQNPKLTNPCEEFTTKITIYRFLLYGSIFSFVYFPPFLFFSCFHFLLSNV